MKKFKAIIVSILSVLTCGVFFMCACGESTAPLFGSTWFKDGVDNSTDGENPNTSDDDKKDPSGDGEKDPNGDNEKDPDGDNEKDPNGDGEKDPDGENPPEPDLPKYLWDLKDLGTVDFHTEKQAALLADSYLNVNAYANGRAELSRPNAVHFEWSVNPEKESAETITQYTVEISTTSEFTDSLIYKTEAPQLDVYNLYIATEYYWRVTAEYSDESVTVSETSTFTTTETAPRNIYVDGLTNVRDLGGWETPNGRVKQGMIYRCAGLNEKASTSLRITESGIDTMRNQLKIRSEIDVRLERDGEYGGITSSPLGEDINYYFYPMEWNDNYILTRNTEQLKQIFAVLADESNYPLIYHCNIGTDRTGLIAFLVNGLLGVSEEDLYYDYVFSNFGNIGGGREVSKIQNSYLRIIKECEGETLCEQIENYLVNAGIPKSDIDSMRRILSA